MKRCPRCNQWFSYDPRTTVDFIHKCRDSSGDRIQSRDEKDHPNKILHDVENPAYLNIGINTHQPDAKKSKDRIKKQLKPKQDVEKYIRLC